MAADGEGGRGGGKDAVERAVEGTRTRRTAGRQRPKPRGDSQRRTPAEIAALGDRFYQAVCAKPGETMTVLAADVGASARELHRPMSLLKRDGRVRSVGQRHRTRYFPVGSEVRASA